VDYERACYLLEHPAVKLLRADQAAFALSFLHFAFKESGRVSISEDSLQTSLERWLGSRREEGVFEWERSAREYLETWCSEEKAWIRKINGEGLVAAFELTSAAEKALAWLDSLQGQMFVGTESRLETIFIELDNLLRQTSGDIDERLDYLRQEQSKLDAEIHRILMGGELRTYEPWQINERYGRILEEARTLVGDFRQVEENFRRIAQDVVERRTAPDANKGEIVGQVLDSHDSVRESPQGRSFYGFVRLLLDPDKREQFERQVQHLRTLDVLAPDLRESPLLDQLLPRLRVEQEKVGASTQQLTANLRRVLETTHLAERRRVQELVGEIQAMALRVKENPPARSDFFEVDELPEVWAGLSRPMWNEGAVPPSGIVLSEDNREADWDALMRLQSLPHLSLEKLRQNVQSCLEGADFVLLSVVLKRFPPSQGVLEAVGYLILGAREPHFYVKDTYDEISISGKVWRLPCVMFRGTNQSQTQI